MKMIRFFLLSCLLSVTGLVYSQQTEKKVTETQKNKVTLKSPQKNNNIKTVPKAKLKQSQLKKINQNKSKLQSQKLKKAIRRSNIRRKPFRK